MVDRILSVVATGIIISLVSCTAHAPTNNFSLISPKAAGQATANNKAFLCYKKNSKTQLPGIPSSKHRVSLSWRASTSLSTPPITGEGYNLYRQNPDGSCTQLNGAPIGGLVYEDRFVELGQTYRYAARAVKRNAESGPSNVIEVSVPRT